MSYKTGFKPKTVTRDKEGHYIMIKGSIQEEGIAIVNIYAPNIGTPHDIRQLLMTIKGEIDGNTIVGDFNTPLTSMDRSSGQKINKETQALNDTLDQIDLIYIYRSLHLKAAEHTFFSSAHRTFFVVDHIMYHKSSLANLRKLKSYQVSFPIITLGD